MNTESQIEVHEHRISKLEHSMEKLSESAINTERNIAKVTELSSRNAHNLKNLNSNYDLLEKRLHKIESKTISEESFKQGQLSVKKNNKIRANLTLTLLGVVAALLVSYVTVHEFLRKPQAVQQTFIKG